MDTGPVGTYCVQLNGKQDCSLSIANLRLENNGMSALCKELLNKVVMTLVSLRMGLYASGSILVIHVLLVKAAVA